MEEKKERRGLFEVRDYKACIELVTFCAECASQVGCLSTTPHNLVYEAKINIWFTFVASGKL